MSAQPLHLNHDALMVGDVHGRLDLVQVLVQQHSGQHLVFVGDLVDRGADSRGVLRLVRGLVQQGQATLLLGNHEEAMIRAVLRHKGQSHWINMGGQETVRSYARFPGELEADAQWLVHHAKPWITVRTLLVSHAHRVSTPTECGHLSWLWGRPERCAQIPLPSGLSASVHGHTPMADAPTMRVVAGTPAYFIDSAAYATGILTALDSRLHAYHINRKGSVPTAIGPHSTHDPLPVPPFSFRRNKASR